MSHENHSVAAVGNIAYMIFSVDRANDTPGTRDYKRRMMVGAMQGKNIQFKTVLGRYIDQHGVASEEVSYIVPASEFGWIVHTPEMKAQESVLVLGPRTDRDSPRPAILHFLNPGKLPLYLGRFVDCTRYAAEKAGAYTVDENGVYWACFPDATYSDDANEEPEEAPEETALEFEPEETGRIHGAGMTQAPNS